MNLSLAGQTVKSARVGLVQMHCDSDPNANMDRAVRGIESAADQGAQIICLPELYRSLYFCQVEDAALFDLAETIPGPSTERLALARKLGVVLIVPIFEKRAQGLYHNSVVVFDADGSPVGHYRKMHIPDNPNFYEKFYFTPGDLGFPTFDTKYGRIGVLICWDQWFPEAARLSALAGAQILFYPTAIGWHAQEKETHGAEQHQAWETVQRGHAVANGLFVAAVNRVGVEGSLEFWGRSFLVNPLGTHLALADESEQVLVVDCDFERIEQIRRGWPFLRDRRIDAYAPLQKG